jgi:hypothetical protein
MMKKRRFTARLLACSLLFALLLCGCGTEGKNKKTVVILQLTPTPVTAATATPTAAPTPETPVPTPETPVPMPETPAPTTETPDMARDWYGWWKMDHTSGDWARMYGYYWDCCAELSEDADGAIRFLLWDEDMPKDDCLAQAVLREQDGALRCEEGFFLDRELGAADWTLTRSEDACGPLWCIEGQYKASGKGGFHYLIYLRPWGSRWPGSEDEKPYYYNSWYLPLIEAGETMPTEIGNQKGE